MKILIADDHSVVRQGYKSLLLAVIPSCILLEAVSGEEAVQLYHSERPDIVIMDISFSGISGIEASSRILEIDENAKILFFSMYDEALMVKQALDAGAMGFITKYCVPDMLIEAVQKVLKGEVYIEYDLIMKLALNSHDSSESRLRDLTQREFEVFVMLARGQGNPEIAATLDIHVKTVSNYVSAIKSKLQIASTAELVHLAVDAGLIKFAP